MSYQNGLIGKIRSNYRDSRKVESGLAPLAGEDPGSQKFARTDREMMARCVELSRQGVAAGELPFGSVIARGDKIIAGAMNRSIREADESRHAEILAVAEARKVLGRRTLRDCTLYSTVEPCPMCSFVIRAAGVRRVVFGLHSPVMGGMSRWDILQHKPTSRRLRMLIGPAPQVVTGVLADEVHEAWLEWRPVIARVMRVLGYFVSVKSDGLERPIAPAAVEVGSEGNER